MNAAAYHLAADRRVKIGLVEFCKVQHPSRSWELDMAVLKRNEVHPRAVHGSTAIDMNRAQPQRVGPTDIATSGQALSGGSKPRPTSLSPRPVPAGKCAVRPPLPLHAGDRCQRCSTTHGLVARRGPQPKKQKNKNRSGKSRRLAEGLQQIAEQHHRTPQTV